jgi:hypothetical protein
MALKSLVLPAARRVGAEMNVAKIGGSIYFAITQSGKTVTIRENFRGNLIFSQRDIDIKCSSLI